VSAARNPPPGDFSVIVAENVRVHFRRGLLGEPIRALDGLTLEVRDGDFFGLVGQNGAGKTTAMNCFLGLLRPTSGRVQVMGGAPMLGSPLYDGVAYLPEEPHYHLYLTVEEAVRYYTALYGKRVPEKAVADVLERLGLGDFHDLPLSKCSKGMKQKVGIAQCLIHETRLLYLDEPTRGLDPIVVRQFRELLREIHQRGATIVMNSHVLSEVEMLANRVAIIEKGKVIAQDELQNLLRLEQDRYTVVFEAPESLPEYFAQEERQGTLVKGTIPAQRLYDFMDYARQGSRRVIECSLKKATLEESFVRILKGGSA
jgi:ABC-2 type transport system ATP-binding protein